MTFELLFWALINAQVWVHWELRRLFPSESVDLGHLLELIYEIHERFVNSHGMKDENSPEELTTNTIRDLIRCSCTTCVNGAIGQADRVEFSIHYFIQSRQRFQLPTNYHRSQERTTKRHFRTQKYWNADLTWVSLTFFLTRWWY